MFLFPISEVNIGKVCRLFLACAVLSVTRLASTHSLLIRLLQPQRYHMHDEMHWMATDPYDMQVNEWRRDVTNYAWVCQVSSLLVLI